MQPRPWSRSRLSRRSVFSVHPWIIAAIERENFRQLCQEADEWWAENPEAATRRVADYHQREYLRADAQAGR